MQKQFKREQRYFVVKVKDAKEYLDAHQLEKLAEIADTISEGREKDGIPAVECVVVESDWPEYESTWRAIEDRVTGAQPAPSEQPEFARKAWARFKNELHRSPDAPYLGMSEAFEQHFSQSFTDRDWRAESGTWAAAWKAAKRHEAQAQLVPNVPEGFSREDLEAVADGLDGYEKTVNVGNVTGEGDHDCSNN